MVSGDNTDVTQLLPSSQCVSLKSAAAVANVITEQALMKCVFMIRKIAEV